MLMVRLMVRLMIFIYLHIHSRYSKEICADDIHTNDEKYRNIMMG